jgi:hypothetical protein
VELATDILTTDIVSLYIYTLNVNDSFQLLPPGDQIFIIPLHLFADKPCTYIHPLNGYVRTKFQVALENIKNNLVFQLVEHKIYEILPL